MARPADPEAEAEAKEWIEGVIGRELEGDTLQECLQSGQALCELINVFVPGATKPSKRKLAIVQRENITQYLKAARKFGVDEYELFGTNDLYDNKDMRAVVTCIHALGRLVQTKLPDYEGPKLGKKVVAKKEIKFTKEQLARARAAPSLLNAGAGGLAGVVPGTVAAVTNNTIAKSGSSASKTASASSSSASASSSSASSSASKADEAEAQVEAEAEAEAPAAAADAEEAEEQSEPAAAEAEASEQDRADDDAPLPEGWEALQTEDGRTYYYNEAKEVTQWDRPTADAAEDDDAAAETDAAASSSDDAPLPEGWEALQTEDGRTYYYNEAKEVTQWDRPTADAAEDDDAAAETDAAASSSDDAPLPEGWEALQTEDGRTYYYNEAKEVTQWDRPTE